MRYYYDADNPAQVIIAHSKNQIDHIFSKHHGFHQEIPPEVIGSYINLRVIPAFDNQSKGCRSDLTIHQLWERYETVDENWRTIVSNAGFSTH